MIHRFTASCESWPAAAIPHCPWIAPRASLLRSGASLPKGMRARGSSSSSRSPRCSCPRLPQPLIEGISTRFRRSCRARRTLRNESSATRFRKPSSLLARHARSGLVSPPRSVQGSAGACGRSFLARMPRRLRVSGSANTRQHTRSTLRRLSCPSPEHRRTASSSDGRT